MASKKHTERRYLCIFSSLMLYSSPEISNLLSAHRILSQHTAKNGFRHRLFHCHLRERPEALLKADSVTDFFISIFSKDLKNYKKQNPSQTSKIFFKQIMKVP